MSYYNFYRYKNGDIFKKIYKDNIILEEYKKTDEAKEIYNSLSDNAKKGFDRG